MWIKTDLFKLVMRKINFVPLHRDRLFFDRFQYSISFRLFEAGCLRARDSTEVLKNIRWRNDSRTRWSSSRGLINDMAAQNILDMWDRLHQHQGNIKFTTSYDYMYIYGNDPQVLKSIAVQSYTGMPRGQEALVTRPRDIVLKKDPKFKLRSYFKEKSLEPGQQTMLRDFLIKRPESYGLTKGFTIHLNKSKWFYLMRHHYIEHDSPADITMLSLVMPGIIRKTVPIQAK